jgi:hypothetical protein
MIEEVKHWARVKHSELREHAKRGNTLAHKVAQVLTGTPPRSPHWHTIEKRWVEEHPDCACGCTCPEKVQVHHVESFATAPQKELEDCSGVPPGTGPVGGVPNFVSLRMCKHECHLKIGHGGSFAKGGYNPAVLKHAAYIKSNPQNRAQIEALAKAARISPPEVR